MSNRYSCLAHVSAGGERKGKASGPLNQGWGRGSESSARRKFFRTVAINFPMLSAAGQQLPETDPLGVLRGVAQSSMRVPMPSAPYFSSWDDSSQIAARNGIMQGRHVVDPALVGVGAALEQQFQQLKLILPL